MRIPPYVLCPACKGRFRRGKITKLLKCPMCKACFPIWEVTTFFRWGYRKVEHGELPFYNSSRVVMSAPRPIKLLAIYKKKMEVVNGAFKK